MATPVAYSEAAGVTHTFSVTYRDAQGASTLHSCWFGANIGVDWTRAVWAYYNVQNGLIYLRDINGTSWSAGAAPGSATVLSNGMGRINCAQTTVTPSGTNLTINWNVTSANPLAGPNHVYAYADDTGGLASGNNSFSDIGTWTITNQAPTVVVSSPAISLSTVTGQSQTVTTTAYDVNGWGNIRNAWLEVNDVNDWTNGFTTTYDTYSNLLYLRSDDGNSWLGGFPLGSTNTISNSSGTLDCSQTTLSVTGNYFRVNWSVSMKSGALGANSIYSYAEDRGGLSTSLPFTTIGSWNVGLAAPTNLVATPADSQITLTWDAVQGATQYQVFQVVGSQYLLLATQTARTYIHTGRNNGIAYSYVVRAYNPKATSGDSNKATATPQLPPSAPTNISGVTSDTSIQLSWTASPSATSYRIEMSSDFGYSYSYLTTVNTTTYTLSNLPSSAHYYFRIAGINAAGAGNFGYSTELVTRLPRMTIRGVAGSGKATISWNPMLTDANDRFVIYRADSASGPFVQVGYTVDASQKEFLNLEARTYYFKVLHAYSGDARLTSPDSNIVAVTPSPGPTPSPTSTPRPTVPTPTPGPTGTPTPSVQAPTNLYVISTGSGKNTLYWDEVPNAVGYYVYRGTTSGGENYSVPLTGGMVPSQASYTGSPIQMWTDTNLNDGNEYFYTVEAVTASAALSNPSVEDSEVVDPDGVPWDSRDAGSILGSTISLGNNSIVDGEDPIDPEDEFTVMGPDGVVYSKGLDSDPSSASLPRGSLNEDASAFVDDDGTAYALPVTDSLGESASSGMRTRSIPARLDSPYRGAITKQGYQSSGFDVVLGPVTLTTTGQTTYGTKPKDFAENGFACLGSHAFKVDSTHPNGYFVVSCDAGLIRSAGGLWGPYMSTSGHQIYDALTPNPKFPNNSKKNLNRNFFNAAKTHFTDLTRVHMHFWVGKSSYPTGTQSVCTFIRVVDTSGTGRGVTFALPVHRQKANGKNVAMYRLQQLAQKSLSSVPRPGDFYHTGSSMRDFQWINGRVTASGATGGHLWGIADLATGFGPNPVSSPPSAVSYNSATAITAYYETGVTVYTP